MSRNQLITRPSPATATAIITQFNHFKTTMANISNIQWPWKNFYKHAIRYMNSLHVETCQPQMKITKFITAARQHFASPAMNPKGSNNSTERSKETMENTTNSIKNGTKDNRHLHQTKSTKQSKRMVKDPNNSTTGRTSNSNTDDTDSRYSTESESNHTAHLPRPPCSPRPTRQHLRPHFNKSQQIINTKCIQGTRPSHIPIPKHTKSSKTSHLSTSTHLQKPSTSTPPNTQTTMKQPTLPIPRTSTASTNQ